MTKAPFYHGRTKHIEIGHHYIRELVENQQITMSFCGTNQQMADILTKLFALRK